MEEKNSSLTSRELKSYNYHFDWVTFHYVFNHMPSGTLKSQMEASGSLSLAYNCA